MAKFNALISAQFLPPRHWVLEKPLIFYPDGLTKQQITKLKQCKIELHNDCGITAPTGYVSDLGSIPRVCWGAISPFDISRASIIHDILYELINTAFINGDIQDIKERKKMRKLADTIFKQGMENSTPPIPRWKIITAFYAVRLFGGREINTSRIRKKENYLKYHHPKKEK